MLFHEKKEEVFRTIDSVPFMDERTRKQVSRYVREFYNTLENPRLARTEILNNCRAINLNIQP